MKKYTHIQIFRTKFLNQPNNLKTIETTNLFPSGKSESINVRKFRNKQIVTCKEQKGIQFYCTEKLS